MELQKKMSTYFGRWILWLLLRGKSCEFCTLQTFRLWLDVCWDDVIEHDFVVIVAYLGFTGAGTATCFSLHSEHQITTHYNFHLTDFKFRCILSFQIHSHLTVFITFHFGHNTLSRHCTDFSLNTATTNIL